MPKQKTIGQFLSNHLWQILTLAFVSSGAFLWLKAEVAGHRFRIQALEVFQSEYPSKEWFSLKFETMEENSQLRFDVLEEKIDANTKKLENL